jgi:hypothetical protein
VINWKELADAQASDELLLEVDQALEPKVAPSFDVEAPLTDWADGPGAVVANDLVDGDGDEPVAGEAVADVFDGTPIDAEVFADDDGLPVPSFGLGDEDEDEDDDEDDDDDDDEPAGPRFGSLLKMPLQLTPKPLELSDGHLAVNYDDTFDEAEADPMELELTDEHLAANYGDTSDEAEADPMELELTDEHLAANYGDPPTSRSRSDGTRAHRRAPRGRP